MEKYTLNLDNDNFILSIAQTLDDKTELDLSQLDLKYLNAYQLINDKVVLNEEKYNELKAIEAEVEKQEEIADLQSKLDGSDYIVARTFEDVMNLDNPVTFIADFIKILKSFKTKYATELANRKAWRERIEELNK